MRWSDDELEIVLQKIKEGRTYKEIAKEFNRTPQSIRTKLNSAGYKFTDFNTKYENKNCKNCKNEYTSLKRRHTIFCSNRCAIIYYNINMDRDYNKFKKSNCINCGKKIKIKINSSHTVKCNICNPKKNIIGCKYCGELVCKKPKICKRWRVLPTLIKLGFNENTIGTLEYYNEWNIIKNLLELEYFDNKLSLTDLSKKYNVNFQTISGIFKQLEIKTRSNSEAVRLAHMQGKVSIGSSYPYKHGWHITWDNKKVYYRSTYELDYCKILDDDKVDYNMENLRIEYWDSQQNSFRVSIPDFHLPDTNEIVEIKSNYTYDEQNMKDRFKQYKKLGYLPVLVLDHKEVILTV